MYDSFVFYRSFAEALNELPAEEYKEVMVTVTGYALDGVIPDELSPIARAMFLLIKPQIDANNSRRKNGSIGGKQTQAKVKQTPSKAQANSSKGEATVKGTQANYNVNDNVNIKEKINKKKSVSFCDDPVLNEAFKSYVEHRKQIKAPMTDRAITLALNKLEELAPGDTKKKCEIISQSVMNGWKGLFSLKEARGPDKPTRGIEREEDLDAIVLRGILDRDKVSV